jgi:hypothetical protein
MLFCLLNVLGDKQYKVRALLKIADAFSALRRIDLR